MNVSLRDLTEKEWQAQVKQLAAQTGWRGSYHTFDSRRSQSGFPDLVLVRERVVYLELKSETGKLSRAQAQWIRWLLDANQEVYVARPRHLEHLGVIMGRRMTFGEGAPLAVVAVMTVLLEETLAELPDDLRG